MQPQDLLGHCLALYQDSQGRIAELEARLRQYGYKGEYSGEVISDPLAHLSSSRDAPAAAEARNPCAALHADLAALGAVHAGCFDGVQKRRMCAFDRADGAEAGRATVH